MTLPALGNWTQYKVEKPRQVCLLAQAVFGLLCIVATPAYADTKTLTADASYIMGDGETPDFAEARALQKAKQAALEEAGTYVQSYTKVQNLDLTTEEIQTIAGGVLQVEVLEKTRSLVADGLRFYTKIKATVTTEKMEELARRIKGKNVAEEYTKLQSEYARLSHELESWKQRAAKTPQGPERNAALDQIREGEKTFARVQQREGEFFQRLVSGKQLVESANRDKEIIDGLLKTIVDSGFIVTVGEVQAVAVSGETDHLAFKVPLTIRLSETLGETVSHAARALGGTMRPDVEVSSRSNDFLPLRIGTDTRYKVKVTLVRLGKHIETARYFQEGVRRVVFLITFLNGTSEPSYCLLGGGGRDWFQLRRIFTVSSVVVDPVKTFDNDERSSELRKDPNSSVGKLNRSSVSDELNRELEEELEKIKQFLPADKLFGPTELRGIPTEHGYVAFVRDEATFVAQHRLPAQFVRNLTGVSVRAISITAEDEQTPRCNISQ